ncbi:hypothetical protein KRP22_013332 [Phytophthora ramorum]|nr:hypothetical protein KRP22_10876 [Phytophthora ramorum]
MTLQDIEWVFRAGGNDPDREALLAPGRKQELLHQLIELLYFEYPDDSDSEAVSYRNPNDAVKYPEIGTQVLKISPEIQLNESALRRLEREERLRQDEARRLEALAALQAKPRRARHRVLCQSIRLRGRHFYVSVYHFPAQARNLVVTAYNPELETIDTLDAVDADTQLFSLELYDPNVCLRCTSFVFSKLEWVALTKSCHEQQQLIPELAPSTSTVAKRLTELRESMMETRRALYAMSDPPPAITSTGKALKTKASSSKKRREELQRTITTASNDIHRLAREAPWLVLVKSLCERCTITSSTDTPGLDVSLDRCIFRSVSPVLRLTNDDNGNNADSESDVVHCRVRVEVLPLAEAVVFEVWDPLDETQWRVDYPESRELLREFAVETFMEQQLHLEAITMSLLLHPNAATGHLELRFEE